MVAQVSVNGAVRDRQIRERQMSALFICGL
jgi:hypothetical protein